MSDLSPSGLPLMAPIVSPETGPYWSATGEGRLVLPECHSCATVIWYPKGICPDCGSTDIEWIDATGRGTVYTFSIVRRGAGPFREVGPFVLAYVELDEGPRVMTNIVGCDPESVEVGQRVVAVFEDTGAGTALLRFRPESG